MKAPALLGVERSAKGKRWQARAADETVVAALARRTGAAEALARVLAARGVDAEGADAFLNPTLRASFPDPGTFADMDAGVDMVLGALTGGRKLCVFADYDVDGATSAALLIRYARAWGAEAALYVPDRIAEGYGPNAEAFAKLKADGVEVVITVDCGAMAHEALTAAADLGLDVVVLDHHQMTAAPPQAAAVINPNRPDCASGAGYLAAVGVVTVFIAALNREARRRDLFSAGQGEPKLLDWLDLTALGTICDVVPLIGANRALAAQGLKVMGQVAGGEGNLGLAALAEVAELKGDITATTAGFVFGPRINAGGRVGRADLGARLLSTDDVDEARTIARQLDALNTERRAIEQGVMDAALAQIDTDPQLAEGAALVVAGADWHPGVIGVVAGRLKEKYAKPAIVIGAAPGSEVAKGSGRSVTGVDLGAAIAAAREAGVLTAGGGHAMAAGLSITPDRVADFRAFLNAALGQAGPGPAPTLEIDAVVAASGVARPMADAVAAAGPFGAGNPEPLFAAGDLRIKAVREVGQGGHLRVSAEGEAGGRFDAIAFRARDGALADVLRADHKVHLAVRIKPGRGRYVDVEIADAARA